MIAKHWIFRRMVTGHAAPGVETPDGETFAAVDARALPARRHVDSFAKLLEKRIGLPAGEVGSYLLHGELTNNPTLVHHGKATAARWHVLTQLGVPLADFYTMGAQAAARIAEDMATALGEPVQVLDNAHTPALLARHARLRSRTGSELFSGRAPNPKRRNPGPLEVGDSVTVLDERYPIRSGVVEKVSRDYVYVRLGADLVKFPPELVARANPSRSKSAQARRRAPRDPGSRGRRVRKAVTAHERTRAEYYYQASRARDRRRIQSAPGHYPDAWLKPNPKRRNPSGEPFERGVFGMSLDDMRAHLDGQVGLAGSWPLLAGSMCSDVQELIAMGRLEEARQLLNRVKWVIFERIERRPNPRRVVDWAAKQYEAKRMSVAELSGALADIRKVLPLADARDRDTGNMNDEGGYYRDVSSVYRAELAQRHPRTNPEGGYRDPRIKGPKIGTPELRTITVGRSTYGVHASASKGLPWYLAGKRGAVYGLMRHWEKPWLFHAVNTNGKTPPNLARVMFTGETADQLTVFYEHGPKMNPSAAACSRRRHNPGCPCDGRCCSSRGPVCECRCRGANHGASSGGYRPLFSNPGGARVVFNRLLGGWYVVVGPHQTPISGRFDSKADAQAWLSGRRANPKRRNATARRPRRNPSFRISGVLNATPYEARGQVPPALLEAAGALPYGGDVLDLDATPMPRGPLALPPHVPARRARAVRAVRGPRTRTFQQFDLVTVPYMGKGSYFGRKVKKYRERATVQGMVTGDDGAPAVLVTIKRGRGFEHYTFPLSQVRKSSTRKTGSVAVRYKPQIHALMDKWRGNAEGLAQEIDAANAKREQLYDAIRFGDSHPDEYGHQGPEYNRNRAAFTRADTRLQMLENAAYHLAYEGGAADPFAIANPGRLNSHELERAMRTFEMWHEFPAEKLTPVQVHSRQMPRHLVALGKVRRIDYDSSKWEGRVVTYTHSTKRPYPTLATDPEARTLYLVGGKMKPTADGLVN